MAINEALQGIFLISRIYLIFWKKFQNCTNFFFKGKIRLLENRIGRLQDDLQDTVNLSQAGGGGNGSGTENVALMIRQHKKAKPVNITIIFIFS